jgi:hypothetical protein
MWYYRLKIGLYKLDELGLGGSPHKCTMKNGICLNPRKTEAMIINCLSSVAADASAIYLAGQQVPKSKNVKNLGLVFNNAFSWENQVNLICRRVYFR